MELFVHWRIFGVTFVLIDGANVRNLLGLIEEKWIFFSKTLSDWKSVVNCSLVVKIHIISKNCKPKTATSKRDGRFASLVVIDYFALIGKVKVFVVVLLE